MSSVLPQNTSYIVLTHIHTRFESAGQSTIYIYIFSPWFSMPNQTSYNAIMTSTIDLRGWGTGVCGDVELRSGGKKGRGSYGIEVVFLWERGFKVLKWRKGGFAWGQSIFSVSMMQSNMVRSACSFSMVICARTHTHTELRVGIEKSLGHKWTRLA